MMNDEIKKACDVMYKGGVILYPTDTVWGIGCDATNEEAVKKVFEIKRRADSKAMLVLVDSPVKVESYVSDVPSVAWDLIDMTTKPLTIIYDGARNLAPNLIAEDGSVGIRVTSEEFSKIMNSTSASTLSDKYIKLCKTLNFKSKFSYANYETTIYDEFLGGDGTTKLMEQLSENGNGFYPINGGPSKNAGIAKEFDGQGFKIENIYINQEGFAGFIGQASNICVKNLTITGTIISKNASAGGICGQPSSLR